MPRKKKQSGSYSVSDSFEKLEEVQEMALNRNGKDDELNPDISIFLKAEELKGKLCGLYSEKESKTSQINVMGSVKIDGINVELDVGEDVKQKDDRIT